MEIDEMIEVLQAFKEGKEVERQTPTGWIAITNLDYTNFNFGASIYRIKQQPKYVPFTHLDYELFMGKIIIDGGGKRQIVLAFDDVDIITARSTFGYARAFEVFNFLDGSVFGKLKI